MHLRRKRRHGSCGRGCKEEYLQAKRASKSAVYIAKRDAQTEKFVSITDNGNNSDKAQFIKMAKRSKRENTDIVGEKCIRDDD